MLSYMRCLKSAGSDSGQCRPQARAYLECRMDNGLMTRDDFQNLGLGDVPSSDANGKLPPTAEALNQHHPSGMEKGAPPTGVSPAPPKQADRI